ncbi:pyridoxal phosphate-dependent aminotransferase [Euzebya tangerina]|uniref:pyridoxal phosphate-dependent aminotransferase n=1 Tax=Euzebya tangerina TaxID=591198 RepID=UPI00196B5548|nr:pyridoxal phosphate-dependent aminotransferase [Euzebya tangerina]
MTSTDPYLTSRLQGFGTTIFTEMSALARRHDAVNLGQGFPDFDPPSALVQAAEAAMAAGHNQYAPGRGVPSLRQAIADHDRRNYALDFDPDTEVIVTTGATEAMFASVQALVEAGDEVVVFEPVYDVYPAAIAMVGATVVGVPLRPVEEAGARVWRFDPDDLEAAVTERTRAILLNSPHNPTGTVFSTGGLQAIADVATRHDLLVVTDEVYEHLVYDDERHTPIATLPGMRERTVRISSAGKTFSVTGWKVGWACAPAPVAAAIEAAKQWITFTSGTPFQHAIAEALSWGESYTAPLAAEYQARRDVLIDGLDDVGLGRTSSTSTYFVTADVRTLGFADDVDFCQRLPAEVGVAAIPCSVFHASPEDGRGWVRFAFCKSESLLAEGLERLRTGLPRMARSAP